MYPMLFSIWGALAGLKRTCPKCHRPQVVASDKRHAPARCRFCGGEIPPPKR